MNIFLVLKNYFLTLVFFTILGFVTLYGFSMSTYATFNDISGHPYQNAIYYLQSQNIVEGYNDGSFRPDQPIQRAEFMKIALLSHYSSEEIGWAQNQGFSDMYGGEWYAPYAYFGKEKGIISGYSDNEFKGERNVVFAESAKIIMNTFYNEKYPPTSPWWKPFVLRLDALKITPPTLLDISQYEKGWKTDQPITRAEMAEMIYRIKTQVVYSLPNNNCNH